MGRGGVGNFFGTLPLDNILKKPLLTKQNYRKKVFFHELLVQVLRKHFRGGWGVQAHAYYAYTGGGGGSRIMENMLM